MKLMLITILCLAVTIAFGQHKFVLQVYHTQVQDCNWGGCTTNFDYVLKVFNDTSVELDLYTHHYVYMNEQFYKSSFTGKGIIERDTLTVAWLRNSFIVIERNKPSIRETNMINQTETLPPPLVIVLGKDAAFAVGNHFPTLNKVSFHEITTLEYYFEVWFSNKQAFNQF